MPSKLKSTPSKDERAQLGSLERYGLYRQRLSDFKTFWLIGSNCIPVTCARLRLEELTVV